jgi:hypothetical protein
MLAAEVAFEEAVLGEDLALQLTQTSTALRLSIRAELPVRADRFGVALRRFRDRAPGALAGTMPE